MTDIKDAAPEGHHYVTMKDRRILVKQINPAQSMVLGGLLRNRGESIDAEHHIGTLGKLMRLVESLISTPEDLEWLESGVLAGTLTIEDFAAIFWPPAQDSAAEKKRTVRRGR